MATAPVTEIKPQSKTSQVVPIKVGWFGGQGSGKTTSAALAACALSKEVYGGAPVYVTDTEPGWQFLRRRVFEAEGVELIQRTEPTFKAMVANLREAEKLGACVWAVDSLTIIWQEIMQSFKAKLGYIPIDKWGDIKGLWNEYTTLFLNSKMSCFALGRLGNEMEETVDDKTGQTKLSKVGTKFKAGGGESFGYEPHLLLELSLERKAKVKAGSRLEGEGRMVHRVDVLKDRTWALNGKVIRWSDKPTYAKGGYRNVWESLKPHFDEVQATMALVKIESGNSQSLISDSGNSEFYQKRERRDACGNEITETLDHLFGGTSQDAKHLRRTVTEKLFGIKSKDNVEKMDLSAMERGLRILKAFEKRCKKDQQLLGTQELNILAHLDIDVQEHDQGVTEEDTLPF